MLQKTTERSAEIEGGRGAGTEWGAGVTHCRNRLERGADFAPLACSVSVAHDSKDTLTQKTSLMPPPWKNTRRR